MRVVHTAIIYFSVVQPGLLASKMERRKVLGCQALCRRNGWSFSPFAVETIGVWGGKANSLLRKLVTLWRCTKNKASLPITAAAGVGARFSKAAGAWVSASTASARSGGGV